MDDRHRDLSGVPVGDVTGRLQFPDIKPLADPFQVMPEPVANHDRFPVSAFQQVFQGIQLFVVDLMDGMLRVVDRAVCHLQQFIGQGRRVHRVDFFLTDGKYHILFQAVIQFLFPFRQLHLHLVTDAGRHLQIILRLHGDCDIGDGVVNLFLRAGPWLIGEHYLRVPLVRREIPVTVASDVPSQPLSHIKDAVFRKKVHQPVAGRRPCQADDPFHIRTHLQQAPEPVRLPALERGKLIDDHHVEVKGDPAVVHQPVHVFPVDDVNVRIFCQGSQPFLPGTDGHRIPDAFQVVPLLNLSWPGIPAYPQGRNDKHLPYLEPFIQ